MSKTFAASPHIKLRKIMTGLDSCVPLLNGDNKTYINFDNAASTPSFIEVVETINKFLPWYSSVHRGSGFKSQLSTKVYDDARKITSDFFGANETDHVVIFGKNTTEAINKLSYRLGLTKKDVILVGLTEHHSNDLPWRRQATVKHIGVDDRGNLREESLVKLLAENKGRVKLVAVSGASNVTGLMPDIHRLAEIVHKANTFFFVDCAQLAPHRQIDIRPLSDPAHIDFIAVSAHKLYAPFGTGALIGRRDVFAQGAPELCGGGTIKVVTENKVEWANSPDRDEAGSPNVIGAVAMAKALQCLGRLGYSAIAAHEADLTAYALHRLRQVPGIKLYGDADPARAKVRLGVICFNIGGMHHGLVSAILGAEWGIGVRNGCFCAHPYVTKLLGLNKAGIKSFSRRVLDDDRQNVPGMVRVSFGLYNTKPEIDELVKALEHIAAGAYEGVYEQNKKTGEFMPRGWQPDFSKQFSLL